jgi:hypothetical protein
MQTKLKRLIIGAAALAVATGVLVAPSNPAQALPPGTPADGTVTIAATQLLTTPLSMSPNPAPAICDGNGVAGYRWHAFISDAANDPATLTYTGTGATAPIGFTSSLVSTSGIIITNQNPSSIGQITPIPGFNLSLFGPALVPGVYNIGFACSLLQQTTNYWSTRITVTATNYTLGAVPAAPVLSLGAGTGTTQTINFTQAPATPAISSYTLNVTPAPGGALPTVAPGATSFELTGLALGTSYSVSLVANNSTGASPAGTVSFSAAASCPAPVVTALDVFDGDPITATWTAPTPCPATPVSYDVALLQGATVITNQPGVTVLTANLGVRPVGSYTVRVTPNFAAGAGVTAPAGTDAASVNPGALIFQELTVARPQGALILTQRCGVLNALPAVTAVNDFPGFPFNLGAATATADRVGTAPILVDASNNPIDGDPATPGVQTVPDPEFPNYPLPNDDAADPDDVPFGNVTRCGLDMGVAQLVTEFNSPSAAAPFPVANLAGEFFAASGRLNEVTVLDTRDTDTGWKLRADIEDRFTSVSNGDSFSGDYLGMIPQMTDDSDLVGGEGPNGIGPLYDQVVIAGPQSGSPEAVGARAAGVVLPGDGFPANPAFPNIGAIGMTDNPVLASAAAGAGLGIATLDARMLLLIPVSIDAADYSATLTLTVAP